MSCKIRLALAALFFGAASTAEIDASQFKLTESDYNTNIAGLDTIPPIVTVSDVLAATNHANPTKTIAASNFLRGYTWEDISAYDDVNTEKWYSQGSTTSADALDTGIYENKKAILVDWYDNAKSGKGVRMSFINHATSGAAAYRNTLLVEPFADAGGNPSFRAVKVHGGGLMWYGNNLFLVDTNNGIRVFDLSHIYKVSVGDRMGRNSSTVYEAFSYAFVVPQSRSYTASTLENPMRWSFISLDRTTRPDSIVVGEYAANSSIPAPWFVRLEIDYTTRRLFTTSSVAIATWAYQLDILRMQGATSIDGKFDISRSNRENKKGDLITWVPGNMAEIYTGTFTPGCEDLSYDHNGNELWTEHPGQRAVFAVKAGSFA